jgi:cysteine desulfurase family protein
MGNKIYFDNAASSWPKPEAVVEAMRDTVLNNGANPGRGSHYLAMEAARKIFYSRQKCAQLFSIRNPNDLIFTSNTTLALNLAIMGFLRENDHVICTSVEHNSVRRPLEWLRKTRNIEVTYLETTPEGELDLKGVQSNFRRNTTLFVANHSSNLLGSITPVEEIAQLTRQRNVKFLVDAAQTAGVLQLKPLDTGIDMIAFPGHKGLYGPQGTGGLYISPEIDLEPMIYGGTGSQSDAIEQPSVRPDRYESGTLNTPGIAGLAAGVEYVLQENVLKLYMHKWELTQRLMIGLAKVEGLKILGPPIGHPRTGIVSFQASWIDCSELAFILDHHFQIAVRAGYHCTPLAHITAGTLEEGAVRASFSNFNTTEEVDSFVDAIKQVCKTYNS